MIHSQEVAAAIAAKARIEELVSAVVIELKATGHECVVRKERDGLTDVDGDYVGFYAKPSGGKMSGKLSVSICQADGRNRAYPEPRGGHSPQKIAAMLISVVGDRQKRNTERLQRDARQTQARDNVGPVRAHCESVLPFASYLVTGKSPETCDITLHAVTHAEAIALADLLAALRKAEEG